MTKILSMTFAIVFLLLLGADLARAQDGAALFKAKCAMCHGADGKGKMPGTTDLAKATAAPVPIITDGKPPKMPAYKGKLSDAEIEALGAYLKGLRK